MISFRVPSVIKYSKHLFGEGIYVTYVVIRIDKLLYTIW